MGSVNRPLIWTLEAMFSTNFLASMMRWSLNPRALITTQMNLCSTQWYAFISLTFSNRVSCLVFVTSSWVTLIVRRLFVMFTPSKNPVYCGLITKLVEPLILYARILAHTFLVRVSKVNGPMFCSRKIVKFLGTNLITPATTLDVSFPSF